MKNIRMIQEDAEEGDAARSLDWTDAMRIATAWTSVDAVVREPYRQLPRHTGKRSCHVAVIAACEGEAVLWSNWTIGHRNGLETLLDVDLRSISWMATDIAPVGHFICGTLQPVVVLADAWVVIATQARQTSSLTAALSAAAAAAGVPVWSLALDAHSENVKLLGAQTSSTRRIPAADLHLAPRTGGVFRSALIERLFGESQELADH